eukprot:TRINITY_DN38824_c0_g1_i1.p1 TRINITY_DN38824_c0_g1~~TRINITY_DN38824_c0_g1_i1.p1  ORF type:complete len:605 (+),score=96.75 TRINITY_DN38824_c0_g1_i1:185-1999(+)
MTNRCRLFVSISVLVLWCGVSNSVAQGSRRLGKDRPTIANASTQGNGGSWNGQPIRGVSLGGWLLTEKWIAPSVWADLAEEPLLDGARLYLLSTACWAWLSAENGGGGAIGASAANIGRTETFVLWRLANGKFKLRSNDGHFLVLSESDQGALLATADSSEDAVELSIVRNPNDTNRVKLITPAGLPLLASTWGGAVTTGSGELPDGWEDGPQVFFMSATAVMQGEFALCNGLGPVRAKEVLETHWSTFITEEDIRQASEWGITSLRIPIGWWLVYEEEAPWPYVSGSRKYLDLAFDWARKYGLQVMVDLHAVPGSVNGWDLGGSRDGSLEWPQPENVKKTLEVVRLLAERYATHPALLGIQLLNEPRAAVNASIIEQYYMDAYDIIREYSQTATVVLSGYIDSDPIAFKEIMRDSARWHHLLLDGAHIYSSYTAQRKTPAWYIDMMLNHLLPFAERIADAYAMPTLVGEWSLELSSAIPAPTPEEYELFAQVQAYVWGQMPAGWFFFTLKVEAEGLQWWSFQKAHAAGWIHSDQWLNPRKPVLLPSLTSASSTIPVRHSAVVAEPLPLPGLSRSPRSSLCRGPFCGGNDDGVEMTGAGVRDMR